jgi:hypothetical protein
MTPKESADNESEILFEDNDVLFLRAKNFEAIDYYGSNYLKKNYYSYRRNTIYLIVSKGEKKGYMIFVPQYGNPSVLDDEGKLFDFGDIIKDYPQIEMEVIELIGGDTAYGLLKLIKSGKKVDKYDLNKVDESFDEYVFNQKNPGKSMIHLTFTEREYFEFFEFSEGDWDRTILENVFSRYGGYGLEIYSSDSAYEDWKEGYILASINDVNRKLLDNIIFFINPSLIDLKKNNSEEYLSTASKLLTEHFSRQADNIEGEYFDLRNEAAENRIKEMALSELPDVFMNYGILKKYSFTSYYTTINTLLSLYGMTEDKTKTIRELFTEIGHDLNLNVGNYNEVGYDAWDYDANKFNQVVESNLQDILDKIEDEPEKYEGAKKYGELLNNLNKLGYEIGRTYELGYDNKKLFRIESIDKSNIKIILSTWNSNFKSGIEKRSLSFEDFVNFLNTPELFESIVRKFKKML